MTTTPASALEEIKTNLKTSCKNEAFWLDFIRPIQIVGSNQNQIILGVKNAFAKQILENEYLSFFENEFSKSLNVVVRVVFVVKGSFSPTRTTEQINTAPVFDSNINNNYVFEDFVVANFNRLAYNAAQTIFEKCRWNPIFITGGVGLGKTHLLHAIGNKFARLSPEKKSKYVTSDEFSRLIYSALSDGSIEKVKNEYESFDLLLFDDVQFLSNKEKINEIFFNIFNNNLSKNKIIVLASDKEPKELSYFNDRMKSRFLSGLLIKITKPDLDTMRTILEHKIRALNNAYVFPKESLDYIARRNSDDIRRLEGCLHQIFFYASSFLPPNSIISIDTIKQIFNLSDEEMIKIKGFDFDPSIVIKHVCDVYRIPEEKIKSKIRTKDVSLVRQVCMYVLKEKFPSISLHQIGSFFGGRDHSTVIESIEKIKKLIQRDSSFASFLSQIIKKI